MSYRAYVWCIGLSGVFLNPSREKLTPFAKRGEGTRKLLSPTWFPLLFLCFSTAPPSRYADAAARDGGERLRCLGSGVSLTLRSVSEDSAGKGHSDSVVPPAGC